MDLRPLALGELVDRSAHAWRSHFGAFFRLYLVAQLVVFIGAKGLEVAMSRWAPMLRGGEELVRAASAGGTPEFWSQYVTGFGMAMAMVLLSVWISLVASVAACHYFIRRHLGEAVTLKDAVARARARLGTITGGFVLSTLWIIGVSVVSMLPGLLVAFAVIFLSGGNTFAALVGAFIGVGLALLGFIAALLLFAMRFLFLSTVIAMEDVGATAAIRRCGALISGRVGPGFLNLVKVRAMILLTIVFAIVTVVTVLGSIPTLVVQAVYANPLDMRASQDAVPQVLLIPAQLITVVSQAAFAPLYTVFAALFYVDMRVRREGLDLELKLSR